MYLNINIRKMELDAARAEELIELYSQKYEEIRKLFQIKIVSKTYSHWHLRRAIRKTSKLNGFYAPANLVSLVENHVNKMKELFNCYYGPNEHASNKDKKKFLELTEAFLMKIYKQYFK